MGRRVGMRWIAFLFCCGFVQLNIGGTVFLERGQRGIVPCPLIKSCEIPPGDVDAVYWFFGSASDASILISYFLGRVAPQNGIPEGVYDIDNEFNLIIENVTASDEGTYYFKLKPYFKVMRRGQVEVHDRVSPSRPYPTVIGCNQGIYDAHLCEMRVRHDSTVHNLTCVMEQVKPAVELRWFLGELTELKASTTVRLVVFSAYTGSSLRNNTYSTSASIQIPSEYNHAVYVCKAVGVAVGEGTHVAVRITRMFPVTANYNEVHFSNHPGWLVQANTDGAVLLERGHRGIVPCLLVKSRQISPGDVVAMYWYYGSISRTSLLISYFLGRVTPQNGIPEGVYDIDSEFSLIIESVTASNEGTYYFQVKPHLKMIEEGQVEVSDKVSPSRPYPTVIGCDQDYDADTCEVRVRHDSTVHNLTCVMEQVKPAVELRWFLGGLTELKATATVRPVVLPAYMGSSLRNHTYSTSASVQVAAVDDEEVYVCEAMGVAVGNLGARMIVRLTKAHHTTVSHDEVQPDNPGTTFFSADVEKPIIPITGEGIVLMSLGALAISVIITAWVYIVCRHKKKKAEDSAEPESLLLSVAL